MLEYELQKLCAEYLDANRILYCASAGGMRTSIGAAVKMKKAGYKKGFPDLFIYLAKSGYHGLAIELKTEKGRLSEDQIYWAAKLISEGYYATHARSYEEFIIIVRHYLSGQL